MRQCRHWPQRWVEVLIIRKYSVSGIPADKKKTAGHT